MPSLRIVRACTSLLVASVVVTQVPAPPQLLAQNDGADTPIALTTSSQVDERLFLLLALEDTYQRWPNSQTDRQQLAAWIAWTRQRTTRVRAWIRANGIDADVGRLYDDCLSLLDTYEAFLANVGAIEKQTSDQAGRDALAAIWKGYQAGSAAQESAVRRGASEDSASGERNVTFLISGFAEAYTRSMQRDAAQKAAFDAEQRRLTNAWTMTSANAEAVADKLTKKYGWTPGEAGFDGYRAGDWNDYFKHRPRDPFVRLRFATTRVKDEKPAAIMQGADTCISAAELVPAGKVYDPYRADFLAEAANLALLATSAQSTSYSAGPGIFGARVLRISRTYLAFDPIDASGRGHMFLARALAFSHRFTEAVAAANAARKTWDQDAGFRYRYARLMSLTNQLDAAGNWLASAYLAGISTVEFVRADPDLQNFRVGRPERFAELTTPRLTYDVVFGVFNDDIVLTNQSAFDLTNVKAQVFIRKGQRTWSPEVTCDVIKVKGTCKAVNIVSIPGSKYDEARATFTSDQSATR